MAANMNREITDLFSDTDDDEEFVGFDISGGGSHIDFSGISDESSDGEIDQSEAENALADNEQRWTPVQNPIRLDPLVSPVGPCLNPWVAPKRVDSFNILLGQ